MSQTPEHLYLELMKKALSFSLWPEPPVQVTMDRYADSPLKKALAGALFNNLNKHGLQVMQPQPFTQEQRNIGKGWPGYADTMIGLNRLDNLQSCIESVIQEKVPGDLIETGVWRGGACILMRAVLAAYGVHDKRVFVADSFEGLPPPDEQNYPQDSGDDHHTYDVLAVSLEQVQKNFERYDLLDDQVVFLKGWFKDTLPTAPIEQLSILRLDGDMYESTMDALESLYSKLSPGGFCIIDDYALEGCKKAVHDYRNAHDISADIIDVDWTGAFWRK
jgi:O-methyltransferase